MLLVVSVFGAGCTQIRPEPPADLRAEAIVVLGNRPPTDQHGQLMPETERRVRRGVETYEDGLAPVVVMTGGASPRGDIEAEVMQAFAIALGVPADAILVETKSQNTIENARFTKQLLSGEEQPARRPHIILVTSPYHLRRARRLFECAGFEVQPTAADPPPSLLHRFEFTAYEVLAAFYYLFIDECGLARGE